MNAAASAIAGAPQGVENCAARLLLPLLRKTGQGRG